MTVPFSAVASSARAAVFEQVFSGPPASLDDATAALSGIGFDAAAVDCPYTTDDAEAAKGWLRADQRGTSGQLESSDRQRQLMASAAGAVGGLGFDLRMYCVGWAPRPREGG